MKVELIYPDVSSFHGIPYHPGLASIGSVLKSSGHDASVSYFDSVEGMDRVFQRVAREKPDVVAFTSVETQFPYARELARRIKKAHPCAAVCGGVYTTLFPEVVTEKDGPFDAVFMGEGEFALLEFVSKLEKGEDWLGVHNLAARDPGSGRFVKNPLRPLMDDLDSLPFPATDLFPYQDIIDRQNAAMFHFGRGCPYRCAFCSNEALGKVYGMPSNRGRHRSVASVVSEITSTLAKYRVHDDTLMWFQDDLFISDKRWIMEFCSAYKARIGRPFWCTGRSNQITDEICAELKKAGCVTLMMSVESGNDYIRNEVMKRNVSRKTLIDSFEMCHRHGINTIASAIIGLPFETPEMIEDSIRTIAGLRSISSYGINTFYPYKGTALRTVCEENGFLPADVSGDSAFAERKDSILDLPTLPREKIRYYHDNWVRLIMKHKGWAARLKYRLWSLWEMVRKSRFGRMIRRAANNTKAGRRFKRYVMKHIWSRY